VRESLTVDGGHDPVRRRPLLIQAIGVLHTPYREPADCPRHPYGQPATSRLVLFEAYRPALLGVRAGQDLFVVWWADGVDRGVTQRPSAAGVEGVFAGRAMDRPNPIGLTRVTVVHVDGDVVVRGLDCVDGTPLLDVKPVVVHGH
jgi:tRNA-Thr(GGU) m(6)t(6)A37 methyltransferase TsaA